MAALEDVEFVRNCRAANREGLRFLREGFGDLGLDTVESEANFLLVRVGAGAAAFGRLQERGIIVRPLGGYELPEYVRITVGTPDENRRLLEEVGNAR